MGNNTGTVYCWLNCVEGVGWPKYVYWEWHLIPRWLLRNIVARFPKQLLSLGIVMKSRRLFHDILLLERCYLGFVLLLLEYCSALWCSAADTHLKLLNPVVSGVHFNCTRVYLSVTLHNVDTWKYYVSCTRSCVTDYARSVTYCYRSHVSIPWPSVGCSTQQAPIRASVGYTHCVFRTSVFLSSSYNMKDLA